MKPEYHRRITTQALAEYVSAPALAAIISANLGQDALRYQFGHDYYHYDNNSFSAGDAYIEAQRRATTHALSQFSAPLAWQAFGRLTHAAQDFYAHSNYVTLWRAGHPGLPADEIPPLPRPLHRRAAALRRFCFPWNCSASFPFWVPASHTSSPIDSHARMNKDDPSRPISTWPMLPPSNALSQNSSCCYTHSPLPRLPSSPANPNT